MMFARLFQRIDDFLCSELQLRNRFVVFDGSSEQVCLERNQIA